jgi:hypothetical protein
LSSSTFRSTSFWSSPACTRAFRARAACDECYKRSWAGCDRLLLDTKDAISGIAPKCQKQSRSTQPEEPKCYSQRPNARKEPRDCRTMGLEKIREYSFHLPTDQSTPSLGSHLLDLQVVVALGQVQHKGLQLSSEIASACPFLKPSRR